MTKEKIIQKIEELKKKLDASRNEAERQAIASHILSLREVLKCLAQ